MEEIIIKPNLIRRNYDFSQIIHGLVFLLISFAVLVGWPKLASAATLNLSPSSVGIKTGSTFNITVSVSSSDQAMNAASGAISFPIDKLEVTSVSKSSSIISLWVQEPSFNNSSGGILFEGIVLNPGYKGAGGRLISISFKTKAAGTADITFSSGSVLANDGKGTNILTGLGRVEVSINPEVIGPQAPESTTPVETTGGVPLAPQVSSSTHLDPDKWYRNNNPTFSWTLPVGITGVNVLADRNPNTNPGTKSDGLRSSYAFNDVDDGVWYFHIRLRNNAGWGAITHFRFQIDNEPPENFVVEFPQGKEIDNPRPTIVFDTTDSLSGVDYYKIKVSDQDTQLVQAEECCQKSNPYTLPVQKPGKKTILVEAYDMAGNHTSATEEFTILAIKAPRLTDYPQSLKTNEILTAKGITYPEAQVTAWLKREKEEAVKIETASDQAGNFIIVSPSRLAEGVYTLWAEATDQRGALSENSPPVTIPVRLPATLKIGRLALDYLTMIVTLVVLIIGIIATVIYSWYRISYWRRKIAKISKTTKATEEGLRKAFITLRDQLENQISKLDGKPGLSIREKQICDKLKQSLQASEKFMEKELTEIEKQLDK
ncbi:MAG: cohesin domain-containing protein [Patescibacteria group bacterium]